MCSKHCVFPWVRRASPDNIADQESPGPNTGPIFSTCKKASITSCYCIQFPIILGVFYVFFCVCLSSLSLLQVFSTSSLSSHSVSFRFFPSLSLHVSLLSLVSTRFPPACSLISFELLLGAKPCSHLLNSDSGQIETAWNSLRHTGGTWGAIFTTSNWHTPSRVKPTFGLGMSRRLETSLV